MKKPNDTSRLDKLERATNRDRRMKWFYLNESPLMTAAEVAAFLRVSPASVYKHASGACLPRIPSVKYGKSVRFRRESIEAFVEAMERA